MHAVHETRGVLSRVEACEALGVSRASYYRAQRRRPAHGAPSTRRSPRALTPQERQQVLDVLHDPSFVDLAVPQVWARLIDQGEYFCSMSTMYRILHSQGEVRERRDQLVRPSYAKPELLATGPNQVWSWDITKLRGPHKWTYFYLYVVLDIFSRYVVGWMVASRQSAALGKRLWQETAKKHAIVPGQLVGHSDRGAPMTAKAFALLLADLGITQSFSRPHVSDDNPFSEAHFKTIKYRPDYPDRFGSLEDARGYCSHLIDWYHHEHRHSSLGWMTPADVHFGRAQLVRAQRAEVLDDAYLRHPERFVRRPPTPPALPQAVWINPPMNTAACAQ